MTETRNTGADAAGKEQGRLTDTAGQERQEIIAAVSTALAEMLGTDVVKIRVLSFRQV